MNELDNFTGELSPPEPFESMEHSELVSLCHELQSKWLSEQKTGMELAVEYEEQSRQLAELKGMREEVVHYQKEFHRTRDQLAVAQADAKHAWEKAGEACTAHAASIKREVMLREVMTQIADRLDAQQQPFSAQALREALAATDDLKGVRLCHAKEVGEVNRYGRNSAGKPWHGASLKEDGSIDLPSGTLLFTAWEPTL